MCIRDSSNGAQYNVTARTAVIASGNDNFYIDVVVYPVVNGTYTLTLSLIHI